MFFQDERNFALMGVQDTVVLVSEYVVEYYMYTSYHVHSTWSDGKAEIPVIMEAAAAGSLLEIGMSDHYSLTPGLEQLDWSMPLDGMEDYVIAVQSGALHAGGDTIVRLGVEADFFPETAGNLRHILASQPFDYVIGSVHIVDGFPIDNDVSFWEPLDQAERDRIIRAYWTRVREMAESRMFDFAGHLDLTKKFGVYPSVDISAEISVALDAIAASDMAVELNTAGWFVPAGEQYPSADIIRGCFDRGIPMLVNADAHVPENLTRAYDRAYALLREVGYTQVARYAGRQRTMHPIRA